MLKPYKDNIHFHDKNNVKHVVAVVVVLVVVLAEVVVVVEVLGVVDVVVVVVVVIVVVVLGVGVVVAGLVEKKKINRGRVIARHLLLPSYYYDYNTTIVLLQ